MPPFEDAKREAFATEPIAAPRCEASVEARVRDVLARARSDDPRYRAIFVSIDEAVCLEAARAADALLSVGTDMGPLTGWIVSVKDLFDVKNQVTTAGSVVLRTDAPAAADAVAVSRLRAAGAVLLGRTNMTEFAFSGVGLNPHYGTPRNPAVPGEEARIPGGSSSGAAVGVALGLADAGLCSDTGGSARIPAALCGLVGFKPTQKRVSRQGMFPLSPTFDCVGWIASSVAGIARLDDVLAPDGAAGAEGRSPVTEAVRGCRFAALDTLVLENMDAACARAYERALARLAAAGASVEHIRVDDLSPLADPAVRHGITGAEAYAVHTSQCAHALDRLDPRVQKRIVLGGGIDKRTYRELLSLREFIMGACRFRFAPYDGVLMPTVPVAAPETTPLESDDDAFSAANLLLLRNMSLANFLDVPAITVPCHYPGEAPVGLSILGGHDADARLIALAAAVEKILDRNGPYALPER